ncbi:hypothetical protein HanPI659440_Chr17g0662121 [Helianthus annuus]|nr:hypothetical protein HanPI659440_Chr17g0662121 [Helianthus annuus]
MPEKKGVVNTEPSEPTQKRPRVTIKPLKAAGVEADMEKKTAEEKKKAVEKEKEKTKEKPIETPVGADPKDTRTAAATVSDKAQGPEVVHITGLDQPHQEKRKEPEVEKITPTAQVVPTVGSGSAAHKETTAAAGGASSGGAGGFVPQSPIGPKDTVGDLYYKTYTEESRGNAPHQAPWSLKQKDMFKDFAVCCDWFLNSFTPDEVIRQRARTHDGLYQDMYQKAVFVEEKAKFEADRKLEEWGREGLRGKLRTAEDLLAKERAEWKKICVKDNERMYAARSKITELKASLILLAQQLSGCVAGESGTRS